MEDGALLEAVDVDEALARLARVRVGVKVSVRVSVRVRVTVRVRVGVRVRVS